MVQATQAWATFVNGTGGVNGHLVELIVYDDGGDPARSRAQVQEAVEARHAVAFIQMGQPLTGQCCIDYLTSKRIPVVGSESGSPWFYRSPMYFPQTSSGELLTLAAIYATASRAVPAGKTKLAFLSCTEQTTCSELPDRVWSRAAPKLGFEVVYKARTSLAQPDFTAECLAARNQGAQVLLIALDSNSVARVAASCARQGFRPLVGIPGGVVAESMKDNPNLAGNLVGSTNVFPWFQRGTPATDEYQRVMSTIGKNIPQGVSPANGWVSGKLLERAARDVPEPPTSEAILRGLWSIQDDDLAGLTQPLTFTENQPAQPKLCLWTIEATSDKNWRPRDGRFQRICPDYDPKDYQ